MQHDLVQGVKAAIVHMGAVTETLRIVGTINRPASSGAFVQAPTPLIVDRQSQPVRLGFELVNKAMPGKSRPSPRRAGDMRHTNPVWHPLHPSGKPPVINSMPRRS